MPTEPMTPERRDEIINLLIQRAEGAIENHQSVIDDCNGADMDSAISWTLEMRTRKLKTEQDILTVLRDLLSLRTAAPAGWRYPERGELPLKPLSLRWCAKEACEFLAKQKSYHAVRIHLQLKAALAVEELHAADEVPLQLHPDVPLVEQPILIWLTDGTKKVGRYADGCHHTFFFPGVMGGISPCFIKGWQYIPRTIDAPGTIGGGVAGATIPPWIDVATVRPTMKTTYETTDGFTRDFSYWDGFKWRVTWNDNAIDGITHYREPVGPLPDTEFKTPSA